ncbi:uncharacterized protein ACIBXB_008934 isoform 2-T3 [Morphnus guianensis]
MAFLLGFSSPLLQLAFVQVYGCMFFSSCSCANKKERLKEAIQIVEQENWLNPKGMAPGRLLGGALWQFVGMILQMTEGVLKRAATSLQDSSDFND